MPADCGCTHYRCNPRARPQKCRTANLVNFHPKNASKVNLTTWTNIITLFTNTIKHFVKISMQKIEIIQRKVAKWTNCCLLRRHFVFNFCFFGSITLHLKSRFWLVEWTEPTWFILDRLAIHRAFFWYRMYGDICFMNIMRKFIHQNIVKSPKYGQQLYHVLLKLDCKESVTESTEGKIYMI